MVNYEFYFYFFIDLTSAVIENEKMLHAQIPRE